MNKFVALGLAFALAAPAVALPLPLNASPSEEATAPPADDAQCDTCDALELLQNGDYRRGRHILELRAAKGDAFAITGFGKMYQMGWGVPVDYDRAMGFYQKAAKQGDLTALNQIGYMVLNGLGRPADPKAAWCWFEQAAEAGYERSAEHLAELMAAGMQPVSCKPSRAAVSDAAGRRQQDGGLSETALELWNGVHEGMSPDQVVSLLPAPYRPPADQLGNPVLSDGVLAPAALFGHPAIAQVLFVDHAAQAVNLVIDSQGDEAKDLGLARELAAQFDAVYGRSFDVDDQGGAFSGIWRRGDLTIDLEYMPLPDQPPTFMVVFTRKGAAERRAPSFGLGVPG